MNSQRRVAGAWRTAAAALLLLLASAGPSAGWSAPTSQAIAGEAARLAPPDLYRQLARHREAYLRGAAEGALDPEPDHHSKNADGSGQLDQVILSAVDNALAAIEKHQPFAQVAYHLGLVAHFVATANNPLNTARSDPREADYYADYLSYMDSVESRFGLVFYGFRPQVGDRAQLAAVIHETLRRSRRAYPLLGREYRRIDFQSGRLKFDDRCTAFGTSALAFSHAVSDIAEVLRYVWLQAGGADRRSKLPLRGRQTVRVERALSQ